MRTNIPKQQYTLGKFFAKRVKGKQELDIFFALI